MREYFGELNYSSENDREIWEKIGTAYQFDYYKSKMFLQGNVTKIENFDEEGIINLGVGIRKVIDESIM
jgi:hypothetical protein